MEKKHLNAHDLFFKGAMQHKEMAQEFFIANIPKNILEKIDLNKIKASNTTFIEEAFKEKRSDVLFECIIPKVIGITGRRQASEPHEHR
jgi:predicted transposase YdaD